MASTVTSSKAYYVIQIDSKKSGANPRGQKDAFPVFNVEFPDIGSKVNLGDDSTHVTPNFPLFTTYDINGGNLEEASASLIQDLDEILSDLRAKQTPTKITLRRVVNQSSDGKNDVKAYEDDRTIELDKATIHLVSGSRGTYQIQADKALMGEKDKAKSKVAIDYKNRV